MKINEVEKLLEIPKATIRFYEKEGLLNPQRNTNSYREYADADVEVLKKIIVLRKIGISVEDIKQVMNGTLALQDALAQNMESLHKQMEEIHGAIQVCAMMQKKEESIVTFNEDYYWDVIRTEEAKGNTFFEAAKDYLLFEKNLLDTVTGGGNKKLGLIAVILLLASVVRGIVHHVTGSGFLEGFLGAFAVLAVVSVIFVPVFMLRKNEKAKEVYLKCIRGIAGAFLIVVLVLFVVMLLNSQLHFLF